MFDDAHASKLLLAPLPGREVWRAMLSGLCATLVGLGLARFAYTPLLPVLIEAHWFSASQASYLGAANLAGYVAGALLAMPMAARMHGPALLRTMMLLATVALLACAWPVNIAWFFAWRFLSGVSGGVLMVLAAPTVLPHVARARRGLAGGVIFMGVGLGIALSGLLVPLLLARGLTQTWLALGALSFALTMLSWPGWPQRAAPLKEHPTQASQHLPVRALRGVYAAYSLNALGLVPHMIFLVDFVARGLGQGLAAGAGYWVLFGLGAVCGPIGGGLAADRLGFKLALRLAFAVQLIALVLPALGMTSAGLMVSSVLMGAFTPGIVGLVLGRLNELLAHHLAAQKRAWGTATTGFAIFQAVGAYALSYLLIHSGGNHRLLFALGAAAVLLALLVDLASGRRT